MHKKIKIQQVVQQYFKKINSQNSVQPFEKDGIRFDNVQTVTSTVEVWIYDRIAPIKIVEEEDKKKCKDQITNHKWQGHLQFILLHIMGHCKVYLIKVCKIEHDFIPVIMREILTKLDKKKPIVGGSPPQPVFSIQRIFKWSNKYKDLDKSAVGMLFGGAPHRDWSQTKDLFAFVLKDFVDNQQRFKYLEIKFEYFKQGVISGQIKTTNNKEKVTKNSNWLKAYESGHQWPKYILQVLML